MSMKHPVLNTTNSNVSKVEDKDIQPNAIDVWVERIFAFKENAMFILYKNGKEHRERVELTPKPYIGLSTEPGWLLQPGAYEVSFGNAIYVGQEEAGLIVPRSTLVRNGLYVTSGLWDSGFGGIGGCGLHVRGGPAFIERGARIGQYLTFSADQIGKYDGSYGAGKEEPGTYKGI